MANIKFTEFPSATVVGSMDIIPIVQSGVNKKATAAVFQTYIGSLFVGLAGTQTITGSKTFSSQLISTVAIGTAPFSVVSTTKVTNLNADLLDGLSSAAFQSALTLTTTGTSGAATLVGSTLNIPNYADTDTGITSLNGLTALTQTFAVGTSGTNFGISSSTSTHTFNLPTASATNRGALSSADWTTFNNKASTAALANYLPLAGGTLTGALNGTSASFSSSVTAGNLISAKDNAAYDAAFIEGANGIAYLGALGTTSDIQLYNGGSTKVTIKPISGNVGIGTSTPTEKLHVSGGNIIVNSSSAIGWGDRTAQIVGATGASGFMRFDTNNAEQMRITSSGNVGIGTTTPKSYASLTTSGQLISLGNIGVDTGQNFRFNNYYNSGTTTDRAISTGFAAGINLELGSMVFKSSASSVSADTNVTLVERMRITPAGLVGIGTATPSYKFQTASSVNSDWVGSFYNTSTTNPNGLQVRVGVSSSAQALGVYTDGVGYTFNVLGNGDVGIGTSTPSSKLNVIGDIHIGDYGTAAARVLDLRTNNSLFTIATDGTAGGLGTTISYSWANGGQGALKFNNAAGEVMRLSSGGNVLIGTTTDAGYKLDVNGTARVQGAVQTRNIQIAGASGGYTTGDNPMIGFGNAPVTNTFGTIEAPFGDKMVFNQYHGYKFKVSNNGASPVDALVINIDRTATFSSSVTIGNFTTTQINALTPAAGMVVFNTTLATLCFYDGSGWRKVSHSSM